MVWNSKNSYLYEEMRKSEATEDEVRLEKCVFYYIDGE